MTNHLWQSTLFAAAAGLLTLAFRTNRAQVRYWLWFSASLKFFVPFTLLLSLGNQLEWAAAQKIATPSVSYAMDQIAEPFPEPVTFAASVQTATDWTLVAVFTVWLCGFAALAVIRFRGWLQVRAAVRASSLMDIAAPVEVRASPGLLEPGVVGLLRPVLLLPSGIENHLTPPQLEAVLTHELCHVRRRDNLFASIHMLVEAVFWFHPVVWWIGSRLVEERERACDEEVLRLGSEPRVYAEGILNVCKLYAASPLRCVSGVSGSNLKKRIEAIMINRNLFQLNFAKKAALAVAGTFALALPIVIGMMNTSSVRAQSAAIPKFKTVSITPSTDCTTPGAVAPGQAKAKTKSKGGGVEAPAGTLTIKCAAIIADEGPNLIQDAYVVYSKVDTTFRPVLHVTMPITGAPDWLASARYDIVATAEGEPNYPMMRGPMMQALLEEHFRLKLHHEMRQVPVFALTVAGTGPQVNLKPFQEGSCTPVDWTKPLVPADPGAPRLCNSMLGYQSGPNMTFRTMGSTLDEFATLLSHGMARPVENRTGITGRFDFDYAFRMEPGVTRILEPLPGARPSSDTPAPSISTVLQEKLGLKLELSTGPQEFLVIDRIERP